MEPRPSPGALEPSSTRIAPQGSPSRITITEAEGRLRLRLGAALGDRLRRDTDGSRSLRPGRPRSPSMARPGRGGVVSSWFLFLLVIVLTFSLSVSVIIIIFMIMIIISFHYHYHYQLEYHHIFPYYYNYFILLCNNITFGEGYVFGQRWLVSWLTG